MTDKELEEAGSVMWTEVVRLRAENAVLIAERDRLRKTLDESDNYRSFLALQVERDRLQNRVEATTLFLLLLSDNARSATPR